VGTGEHGGQDRAEARVGPCPVEEGRGLLEAVDRPTIVALGLVGEAEVLVRQRVEDDISARRGECAGTLAGGDGLAVRTPEVEMVWQKAKARSQPTRVVEGLGERLGLTQQRQDTTQIAEPAERRLQGEAEIDRLLACVALLG